MDLADPPYDDMFALKSMPDLFYRFGLVRNDCDLSTGGKLDALQHSAWHHEHSHSAGWLDRFLGPRECRLGSEFVHHYVLNRTVIGNFVNFDNLVRYNVASPK